MTLPSVCAGTLSWKYRSKATLSARRDEQLERSASGFHVAGQSETEVRPMHDPLPGIGEGEILVDFVSDQDDAAGFHLHEVNPLSVAVSVRGVEQALKPAAMLAAKFRPSPPRSRAHAVQAFAPRPEVEANCDRSGTARNLRYTGA